MWFSENKGLVDNVTDRRVGLLFIEQGYSSHISNKDRCNVIIEVTEIYNDKVFSKIEVIKVAYNKSDMKDSAILKKLNPWIESIKIHWLSPSTPVDRNNKLNEILNK